jgi:hypothetical protein
MSRALLVLALSGCVTGAGIVRKDRVTLPILLGAAAADLVIGSLVFAQSKDLSTAGAIASGIAFTAVDLGIGCVIGACAVLRP